MKNLALFICDADDYFLDKLTRYIDRQEGSPFQIKTYNNHADLIGAKKEGFLLIQEKMMPLEEAASFLKIIILCESIGEMTNAAMDYLYKYQSARSIYTYLVDLYIELMAGQPAGGGRKKAPTQIWGVYSPVGRIGKSQWAHRYLKEAAREDCCLYIDMGEFSKSGESPGTLSDLIYMIKEKQYAIALKLEQIVVKGEAFDELPAPVCPYELWEMNEEEWRMLFGQLTYSKYAYILIDFGSLPPLFLLELCEKVFVPYIPEQEEKLQRFEALLSYMEREDIKKKINKVCLTMKGRGGSL